MQNQEQGVLWPAPIRIALPVSLCDLFLYITALENMEGLYSYNEGHCAWGWMYLCKGCSLSCTPLTLLKWKETLILRRLLYQSEVVHHLPVCLYACFHGTLISSNMSYNMIEPFYLFNFLKNENIDYELCEKIKPCYKCNGLNVFILYNWYSVPLVNYCNAIVATYFCKDLLNVKQSWDCFEVSISWLWVWWRESYGRLPDWFD